MVVNLLQWFVKNKDLKNGKRIFLHCKIILCITFEGEYTEITLSKNKISMAEFLWGIENENSYILESKYNCH